ncbi:uncharacterized protein LOC114653995 isoform X2 [Erpetoichthys calabaricus]|uniref:uncharacterized protein LOC114653995 isoform X2 n=1 Tax=Erpetoichthys calabaricus TaxID=27687 RepID=UPI002233F797|nr:uncharacterized protein LOC114653995 isoform X2 [Erpetoichthys calabaricus]
MASRFVRVGVTPAPRCSVETREKTMAVFEQADDYKQKFVAEITDSFKNGICKILQLARDLQAVDRNHMENDSWKIRISILVAKITLSQSEMSAKGHVEKVDGKCVNLVYEKKRLETEEKEKREKLFSMQTNLKHLEEMLKSYKESLNQANRNLSSAQENVKSARHKAREQETVRDVGIGMLFLPFIGPIVGGIMIGVGQTAMENAEHAERVAQENADSWKSEVAKHNTNFWEYINKINLQKKDIDLISGRLQKISCELKSLSQVRLEMGEVQKKLKDATFYLSTLAGKMQAAEVQTRIVVFFDPLINILHDITQYLCKQKNLELFQLHVEPMIKQLKEENARLKAICDDDSESIQFY